MSIASRTRLQLLARKLAFSLASKTPSILRYIHALLSLSILFLTYRSYQLYWLHKVGNGAWGPAWPTARTWLVLSMAALPTWSALMICIMLASFVCHWYSREVVKKTERVYPWLEGASSRGEYEVVLDMDPESPARVAFPQQPLPQPRGLAFGVTVGRLGLGEIRWKVWMGVYVAIMIGGLYVAETYEQRSDNRFKKDIELAVARPRAEGYGTGEKVFIAAMFYNNEHVVPFWTQEITKAIRYLGTDNVYISIVESNSDDSTPSLLRSFDSHLSTMNVSRRILTNDTSIARPKSMSTSLPRIEFLSAVRNRVMEPLINQSDFDRVVFSNDVFVTAEGIVELLNTREGNYAMACGTDLAYWGLHDAWVTRDRLGHLVSSQWPYLLEDTGMNAIMKDEPAPVFTCWNGIVSFRPDPFLPPSSRKSGALSTIPANFEVPESHPWVQEGRVRKGMAPVEMPELRFRASGRRECFGSESFNLPYDLRRVYDMQEIYMNPRVITSYEWSYFVWYKYVTRHWLVKWWIEKVEMGDGMHRAKMIVGEADRVWTWDGGECQPGLDWS